MGMVNYSPDACCASWLLINQQRFALTINYRLVDNHFFVAFHGDGRSYMVSSSAASTMERRPLAPVLRAIAFLAIQRLVTEFQIHAFQIKQRLILLGQGVFRLFEDLNQSFFAQFIQRCDNRQTTNELKGSTDELDQIFRFNLRQQLAFACFVGLRFYRRAKTNASWFLHDGKSLYPDTGTRTATNKQDLRGINLQEIPCCGCLRPPCGGTATVLFRSGSNSARAGTPSPETSRATDGLSDLREILSISSMQTIPRCAFWTSPVAFCNSF